MGRLRLGCAGLARPGPMNPSPLVRARSYRAGRGGRGSQGSLKAFPPARAGPHGRVQSRLVAHRPVAAGAALDRIRVPSPAAILRFRLD